jgi:hypothetical protein
VALLANRFFRSSDWPDGRTLKENDYQAPQVDGNQFLKSRRNSPNKRDVPRQTKIYLKNAHHKDFPTRYPSLLTIRYA